MIQHVERLQPECRRPVLVDREDPRDLRIELQRLRPAERVSADVSVGSEQRQPGASWSCRGIGAGRSDLGKGRRIQVLAIGLARGLCGTLLRRTGSRRQPGSDDRCPRRSGSRPAPEVTVKARPVWMWMSGANSQSLTMSLASAVEAIAKVALGNQDIFSMCR